GLCCRQAVDRTVGIGKLGRCLEEGHAAKVRRAYPFLDEIEQVLELVRGLFGAGEPLGQPVVEIAVGLVQYRRNQVFLGAKVLVQGHLGRTGSGDYGVDASRVDAARLEQIGSGDKYFFSQQGHSVLYTDFTSFYRKRRQKTIQSGIAARRGPLALMTRF